jgi:ABC-type nitrate/sulfonate/bicarbonate transport system substrate-binding protein
MTATLTADSPQALDQIWYTRCPVPTASGLALNLGWLAGAFRDDGLDVGVLQDGPPELRRHHFDHQLLGLFREGGNVPAFAARAEGADTRLIGLTWIDEGQSIIVRPDSGIDRPAALRGAKVALPQWADSRAASFPRAMAVAGIKGALSLGGLTLDDVRFVEVESNRSPSLGPLAERLSAPFPGFDALLSGHVDAVYVKGARAAEEAVERGLAVGVDLDSFPDRRTRVNNGTPRPITVHAALLEERPDVVVRFVVETLRAADWAADHLDGVREVLARETGSGAKGVELAYRDGFHRALHPTLDDERLALFEQQAHFLHAHGFLAAAVDVEAWVAREPLAAARAQLDAER